MNELSLRHVLFAIRICIATIIGAGGVALILQQLWAGLALVAIGGFLWWIFKPDPHARP